MFISPSFRRLLAALIVGALVPSTLVAADDINDWIEAVQSVSREGHGHTAATAAIQKLQQAETDALLPILQALRSANPLAQNWLAAAFESIAHRAVKSETGLPAEQLREFILDRQQSPRARRLAYEWLKQVQPELEDQLIPGMLLDPSPEFRRDAVQRLIGTAAELAEQGQNSAARETYEQALKGAVDDDQVKAIVKPLKSMGVEVDLQKHFGFVVDWQVVGPFDNREMKGFAVAYPPEESVDLKSTYEGQLGEVSWQPLTTTDEYGVIDIAKAIQNYKGSAMYLVSSFASDREQDVEFRLGTPNAWKLWVNGELLFAREEYHRGTRLDQYRVPVHLNQGSNQILLKICQNEQTQDWAQDYQVQLRVCDPAGSAILESKPE